MPSLASEGLAQRASHRRQEVSVNYSKNKADTLNKLAEVALDRSSENIERALLTAREMLGMEVAFLSEFTEDLMVLRKLSGDVDSFGWREGQVIPLTHTFCKRAIDGSLPNVVPDAQDDECAKDLDITAEAHIRSYIGVPVRLSHGRLYGMMCCLSHSPDPSLQRRDEQLMNLLARMIADQVEREELKIKATAIEALLNALEMREGYAGEHSKTVVKLSTAVARRMDLSEEEVKQVEQAALLHDIGKLDDDEREVMRKYTLHGELIVFSIESLAHLAPIIRSQHERWDGKGYPDGLSSEQIPLASRIVYACDAFHAMTSERPYRKAMGVEEALVEIENGSGTQFDPRVVVALIGTVESAYP